MDEREATLQKVNAALPALKKINDLYIEADNLENQAAYTHAANEQVKAENKVTWKTALGVAPKERRFTPKNIALAVVLLIVWSVMRSALSKMGTFGDILAIVILAVVVVFILKWRSKLVADSQTATDARIDQLSRQYEAISNEIYQTYTDSQAAIEEIPRDYRYFAAVSFFESALANGRADNMKEAINLYEEHIHRQSMEANSRALLEQSRQQSAMMASIERSARQTAINTDTTAIFSVLNFLSRG